MSTRHELSINGYMYRKIYKLHFYLFIRDNLDNKFPLPSYLSLYTYLLIADVLKSITECMGKYK